MVWGWVHNFPASVDVFTKPIDYPNVGYDTIIANWLQDIFDAVETIQDTLGYDIRDGFDDLATRLSGRIYHTRIVGGTPDFDGNDFTTDGEEYFLDLSGIIPVGTKAIVLNGWIIYDDPELRVIYPVNAGADKIVDGFKIESTPIPPEVPASVPFNVILPVDATRRIAYQFNDDIWGEESSLSVTGWFK